MSSSQGKQRENLRGCKRGPRDKHSMQEKVKLGCTRKTRSFNAREMIQEKPCNDSGKEWWI